MRLAGSKSLRSMLLSSLLLMSLADASNVATDVDSLRNAFLSPPASAGPYRMLGLRGGDIDDQATRARLASIRQAGYGGVLISATAPLGEPMTPEQWSRVNEFAQPSYFKHLATLLNDASAMDLSAVSTLGSCWPMGGGLAITPELAQVEVTVTHQQVRGGTESIQLTIPGQPMRTGAMMRMMRPTPPGQELPAGWAERLKKREKIIAVLAVKGTAPSVIPTSDAILGPPDGQGVIVESGQLQSASAQNVTRYLRPDGRLGWRVPEGTWQLFVFKQVPSDLVLTCGAGRGPQLVMDHFKREALEAHTKRVFEAGRAQLGPFLGKTLTAYTVDSLENASDLYWTDELIAEFKRRRGYDLVPYLPLVFQPGWMAHPYQARLSAPQFDDTQVGERVRADYRLTVSELMIENLYEPFAAWAKKNGLHSEFQAHGAPVDILKAYGTADVPESEDLHVGPDPYFLKLARSGADLYGRQIVSTESMIWDHGGPSLTPQDLKRRADELLSAGINRLRIDGFDPGPAVSSLPPEVAKLGAWLSSRNPAWAEFERPFVSYLQRAQVVLQQGRNVVPLAIFRSELAYVPTSATQEPKIEQPRMAFIDALPEAGYDYDAINADVLIKSQVRDRALITPSGMQFNALILPTVSSLRVEVAAAIEKFASAGLPILFVDRTPARYEGLLDHEQRDEIVRTHMAAARSAGARQCGDEKVIETLRDLGVAGNVTFEPGRSAPFLEKRIGDARVFFFRNPDAESRRVAFATAGRAGAQVWDPWTGTIQPANVTTTEGRAKVELQLLPNQSVFVVVDSKLPVRSWPTSALFERPVRVAKIGEQGWQFAASGAGAGGRKIEVNEPMASLADWTTLPSTRDFSGEAVYSTRFTVGEELLGAHRRVLIDLGSLNDGATLRVNGKPLLLNPSPPYVADVTDQVQAGENQLEVVVYNTLNNMVAASAPGISGLRPAGLLGPVWLLVRQSGLED